MLYVIQLHDLAEIDKLNATHNEGKNRVKTKWNIKTFQKSKLKLTLYTLSKTIHKHDEKMLLYCENLLLTSLRAE